MKPQRTADLSLFLTVTGLLLASLAFASFDVRAQASKSDEDELQILPISQSPDSLMPPDDWLYGDNTQAELSSHAEEYAKKTDSVLNFVYHSIIRNYSVDTQFIRYFKQAEEAWIKYRNAEMLAIMPPDLPGELGGSMEPQCWAEYQSAFARERIGELLMWLKVDETDQTGCDTFYPESLLKSMRDEKNHKEK